MTEGGQGRKAGTATDAGLRRFGRLLAGALGAAALLLPVLVVVAWVAGGPGLPGPLAQGLPGGASAPPPGSLSPLGMQAMAMAILALPVVLVSAALLAARRCCRCFAAGAYLTAPVVVALKVFARRLVLAALAGVAAPTLAILLLTAGAPAGQRVLSITIDSQAVLGLLIGGTLWAIAAVMARAVSLAEDHAAIV